MITVAAAAALVPTAAASAHLIAYVDPGTSVALRDRPFGRIVARVGATTPFGSHRALGVVRTRGRWLAVTDAAAGSNKLVWLDANAAPLLYARTNVQIEVDLSSRSLSLLRSGQTVRRVTVDIGSPASPTPTGRFSVTDKVNGRRYGAVYGCCILVLSAVQLRLPAGWRGGNRVAIHGTLSSRVLGATVSAGCVHARDADLRLLMRAVPLGTPVVIHQ